MNTDIEDSAQLADGTVITRGDNFTKAVGNVDYTYKFWYLYQGGRRAHVLPMGPGVVTAGSYEEGPAASYGLYPLRRSQI
jgi:hypothetical protein